MKIVKTSSSKNKKKLNKETQFLLSIPGMKKSIVKGMKEPIDKASKKLKW
jgi:hypothetical protein